MSTLFGWDLLYNSVKADVKNNEDILVCLTHLVLVTNGFKCIGIGESKVLEGSETKSEALPAGWNDDYALRYLYQGRLYNLKGTVMDNSIMIHLFRVDERTVSMIELDSSKVEKRNGTLEEIIPTAQNLADNIKQQLIDNVVVSTRSKESSSQTEQPRSSQPRSMGSNPLLVPAGSPYGMGIGMGYGSQDYGRADLDPFNGMDPLRRPPTIRPGFGGGGMLFNPPPMNPYPGPQGMPPGAIPPGARFDPFRPPDNRVPPRGPPNRPDNDEMPPPGYDDMFM